MKTRKILIIFAAAILTVLTSCEDFLIREPRLSQTNELTLSTYDGLEKSVIGAYSPLYSLNWYGRNFVIAADLKGGNAKLSPLNSGRFRNEYFWINNPNSSHGLWSTAYVTIARVNNVLEALDGFEEAGVTEEQLGQLEGECKFLRALAYHDLVRLFSQQYSSGTENLGVPVVLVTETNGQPARNTVGEVYNQIVSDLNDAEALLSETNSREGTDDKAWANKDVVNALQARVYLYMENWSKAAEYATKVIESGNYSLYTPADYTTWDNGGVWGSDGGSEIIFEIFGAEGNSAHGNWDVISYIINPGGYGDIGASADLTSLYEENDVRGALFVNTADYQNSYWSLKYPGKNGNLREDNIPVLRLSEMYLIRMEAQYQGASVSGTSTLADYNTLRAKRGLDAVDNVAITDIYDERRRELCFEGHQLFDLARTKRGLVRVDYDGTSNQNIPFPNYLWAMPIPQTEMDANDNMVQNPDYN